MKPLELKPLDLPVTAPAWMAGFRLSIEAALRDLLWPRVREAEDAADLPDATKLRNRLCRLADTGQVVVSNGTAWTDLSGTPI